MRLFAIACRFKREERAEWEAGIALSKHDGGTSDVVQIVGMNGISLGSVPWDFSLRPHYGCLSVNAEDLT